MKYIVFLASLACVTAAPSLSELEKYAKNTHRKINQLSEAMGSLIPNLDEENVVFTLTEEKDSLRVTIKHYIAKIPQHESLKIYKDKLSQDLSSQTEASLTHWDKGSGRIQNYINRIIQSSRVLIDVLSSNAETHMPNASPEDQETIFKLAKEAMDIAHQKVKDLSKVLRYSTGTSSGTKE